MKVGDTYYRYEDVTYAAPLDEFGESRGEGTVQVHLLEYRVIKVTRCGCWLELCYGYRRFMLTKARKRFACPTVAEARESFVARKRRQIVIYKARLRKAEQALKVMKQLNSAVNHEQDSLAMISELVHGNKGGS